MAPHVPLPTTPETLGSAWSCVVVSAWPLVRDRAWWFVVIRGLAFLFVVVRLLDQPVLTLADRQPN